MMKYYNDTYGLLRTSCSRNPTQYSHIAGLSSRFYANIGAGPKVLYPHLSELNVGKDFGTLVSLERKIDKLLGIKQHTIFSEYQYGQNQENQSTPIKPGVLTN